MQSWKKMERFPSQNVLDSIRKGECLVASCRFTHVKGTRREPIMIKNIVNHNNKPLAEKDEKIKSSEPDHFLEIIRLMKEEILETMNKKITSIESNIHHLQQTQTSQIPQFPMPTVPMVRPFPQQTINPIHFQ